MDKPVQIELELINSIPKLDEIIKYINSHNAKDLENNNSIINELLELRPMFMYKVDNNNCVSFNYFGCWNGTEKNTLSDSSLSGYKGLKSLEIMVDMMNKNNDVYKPICSITSGDNYYGKDDTTDEQMVKYLNNGFDEFKNLTMPFFMSVGNHDVKLKKVFANEIYKCYTGISMNSTQNKITINKWILPSTNYVIRLQNNKSNCTVIFVDTNMFMQEYTWLDATARTLAKSDIIKWLDTTITKEKVNNSNPSPIFVVGHHPFFAVGHKTKKPFIVNTDMDPLYNILVKHKIKFYLCADEHNFQYIYDNNNDIHHIISGGASSGDESVPFIHQNDPYDSRGTTPPINTSLKYNITVKIVINSPHYVNFRINNQSIIFDVISFSTNEVHSLDHLRNKCVESTRLTKNDIYAVCYSQFIPKYPDYIFIMKCKEYIEQRHKELNNL